MRCFVNVCFSSMSTCQTAQSSVFFCTYINHFIGSIFSHFPYIKSCLSTEFHLNEFSFALKYIHTYFAGWFSILVFFFGHCFIQIPQFYTPSIVLAVKLHWVRIVVTCVWYIRNILLVDLNVNGKVLLNIFSIFPFFLFVQPNNKCFFHVSHRHKHSVWQWVVNSGDSNGITNNVFYLVISVFCIQCFHSIDIYKCKQFHNSNLLQNIIDSTINEVDEAKKNSKSAGNIEAPLHKSSSVCFFGVCSCVGFYFWNDGFKFELDHSGMNRTTNT